MKRKNTPHYIVELPLKTEIFQEDIINTRMEIGRSIYNALLTIALNRFTEMTKTKRYRILYESLIHLIAFEFDSKDWHSYLLK